jgi:hypothetical protein
MMEMPIPDEYAKFLVSVQLFQELRRPLSCPRAEVYKKYFVAYDLITYFPVRI